jgi:hypothetical protein
MPAIMFVIAILFMFSCATRYKAKPMPFKSPASYPNATVAAGATIGARAYADPGEAKEAFGFDILGAGMLPVQVVFDHQGEQALEIRPEQTFLEDRAGNLWPILSREIAYDRATRYAETHEIFEEGTKNAFWGAAAGAIIGAAIGIVSGNNIASAAGKGAALGGAAGATLGGVKGATSGDARRTVIDDLQNKSLQNKAIHPGGLAFGFLFFPAEARTARELRLQIIESGTDRNHVVKLGF